MSVLEVNHVSIRYMMGDFKEIGLKEYFLRRLKRNYNVVEFWADKDINFSLEQGDMLGIIGTNGAGKSTLLKVISGIMEPTKGWVKREGTIAALLELASGFDGDLSVRENTYLRGAMLGYTRKFMDETYDRIIQFAELSDFQDRPFKQLSSGMKSRLAFSIACLVQPDILILDEVLSVGDGSFRTKSEAKMQEIIHSGATSILVSHSIEQVRKMCNKVLWLHKGEQIAFGDDVQGICDRYAAFLNGDITMLRDCPTHAKNLDQKDNSRNDGRSESMIDKKVDGLTGELPANTHTFIRGGELVIEPGVVSNKSLQITVGNSSKVIIHEGCQFFGTTLIYLKENAFCEIGKNCRIIDSRILCADNATVIIGDETSINDNCSFFCRAGHKIEIGKDCMFLQDAVLHAGDVHPIYDTTKQCLINDFPEDSPARRIVLHDHVWVGFGAMLLQNTEIGTGCIVGAKSLVKDRFPNNCLIAGHLAQKKKINVGWKRYKSCSTPELYMARTREESSH